MLDLSFDLAKSRAYRDKLKPVVPKLNEPELMTTVAKAPVLSFVMLLDQLENELKASQHAEAVGFIFDAMRSTLEEVPVEEVSKKLSALLVDLEEILDALIFWS